MNDISDLISREEAAKRLEDLAEKRKGSYSGEAFEFAAKIVRGVPAAVRWIPVEERFPNKANSYICRCIVNNCADMPFYMVLSYILYDKNPHFQHETTGGMKVTHWMPLPEPPKEAKEDGR